ncbi:MAG TPA: type I phosphomannose isomerase catalytic subunit [Terracidiphilus sp.]|jgi:mannose-6-phosphate isomerase
MPGGPASPHQELAPFLIDPLFVSRVWGYHDLRPWYDVKMEPGNGRDPIGEVWLTGDECRVATGQFAGSKLGEVFPAAGEAILGPDAPSPQSPLLVKVIFAREKLSVQVHPDDTLAAKYGQPRGKTESWYALSAEDGAQVAAGLKDGVTIDQVRAGIERGTLEQSLNVLPVKRGDMVFVDAGTVHAIWPGSILLETQQNSDITYRMYDYGRPRELHVEKSLEATRLETRAGLVPPRVLEDRTILIDVEYFRVERVAVEGSRPSASLPGQDEARPGLSYLFAAAGSARLSGSGFAPITLPPRGIAAIPAASPAFTMEDRGGLDLIRISPRWPRKPL